jgi:hypothetical protein
MNQPPDDLVERLVKLAEPGPEIPPDGATRVKAAVRPAWQREVRSRTRRRYAVWAAAATVAILLSVLVMRPDRTPAPPSPVLAQIEVVRGEITIRDGAGRPESGVGSGAAVRAGSTIITASNGLASLRMSSGTGIRVDAGSILQFLSADTVVLETGALYVDASGKGTLEVRTPLGVARDIGTRFEVRHGGDELLIRVRDGAVSLQTRGQSLRVDGGRELSVRGDGSTENRPLAADAAEWAWAQAVAPPFPIEGRTVKSFLDWVSRETGADIRYDGVEVERLSSTTVLHGSLGDLRPDQAAQVILPSAGLEAARDRSGALVVRRADP